MKIIFVSGFRWSGSSAASELIEENFVHRKVPGEEFVPLNLGLLPIKGGRAGAVRRFFAPFFVDPANYFHKVGVVRFAFLRGLIFILGFNKKWLRNYSCVLDSMIPGGYRDNVAYRLFVMEMYDLREGGSIDGLVKLIVDFIDIVAGAGGGMVVANNSIPAAYSEILSELSRNPRHFVVTVNRNPLDQAREIRKYSFSGRFCSFNKVYSSILNARRSLFFSEADNVHHLSFEGLVLNKLYRDQFLEKVSKFVGVDRGAFSAHAVANSAKNIGDRAKQEYSQSLGV